MNSTFSLSNQLMISWVSFRVSARILIHFTVSIPSFESIFTAMSRVLPSGSGREKARGKLFFTVTIAKTNYLKFNEREPKLTLTTFDNVALWRWYGWNLRALSNVLRFCNKRIYRWNVQMKCYFFFPLTK